MIGAQLVKVAAAFAEIGHSIQRIAVDRVVMLMWDEPKTTSVALKMHHIGCRPAR